MCYTSILLILLYHLILPLGGQDNVPPSTIPCANNLLGEYISQDNVDAMMNAMDDQPVDECCACDEAKYEVIFEGLWSKFTHPKDFPSNSWLTHFSDIIGASHSSDFRMWEYAGYATEGLQEVVELGITKKLEAELKAESNKIRTIIKARGLWHPNLNGKTFAVFRVDKKHHLMSLVSMLGPSPDWFVGVSAMELCLRNCSWLGEKVMNLYLWDAGTDGGISYLSPNQPLIPHQRISRVGITNNANLSDSPFYDVTGARMNPFARLTITRQRMYEKPCDAENGGAPSGNNMNENDNDNNYDSRNGLTDDNDEDRPECMASEWTEWSPCSVNCGQGVRMRTRSYLSPQRARSIGCSLTTIEKEICETECIGDVSCATTPWSEWTSCSVECGKGYKTRTRLFANRMARKVCSQVDLVEKEPCFGIITECPDSAIEEPDIDPQCMVTQWSEWSPCTVSCGKGIKARTRLYVNPNSYGMCDVELMQKMPCFADKQDCTTLDTSEAKDICVLEKEIGPCRGYFPRWYYDASKGMCLQFIYGGCRGNKNNFEQYEECNRICQSQQQIVRAPFPEKYAFIAFDSKAASLHLEQELVCAPVNSLIPLSSGQLRNERNMPSESSFRGSSSSSSSSGSEPIIDCVVTPWGPWSECSRPCGRAQRTRRRMVKMSPQNGGKDCPTKLTQRRRCKDNPPCPADCILSEWGEWSNCSVSCGTGGIMYRQREVIEEARYGGAACGPKIERTYCSNLPPCDSTLNNENEIEGSDPSGKNKK